VLPPPAPTDLRIIPESFRITSGSVIELVAVLTRDNLPVRGRLVGWMASAGRVEAKNSATDVWGEVRANFFAPEVENEITVTITAYFTGDDDHLPSEDNAVGAVVPRVLPQTTLTITPASFNLKPGENRTLVARLKSDGVPLAGKPVEWDASLGQIIPQDNTTDSRGEARATYVAPSLDVHASVTVSATFPGDNWYGPSRALSNGAILLPDTMDALENIQGAIQEVGVQVTDENLVELRNALVRGDIGASLTITIEVDKPGLSKGYEREGVRTRLGEVIVGERIDVVVESTENYKTIVINIENDVLPVGWISRVLVDNNPIDMADDYADVLDPTNDNGRPEYLILKGGRGAQVLVSIPHFSQKTITISSLQVPVGGIPNLYLVLISIIVLITVILAVIWRRKFPRHVQAWTHEGAGGCRDSPSCPVLHAMLSVKSGGSVEGTFLLASS